MIVMKYFENGNLYQYLDRSNGVISWINVIDALRGIAEGLERIHVEGKVHKNLHGGNLFVEKKLFVGARIADVGLYGPCVNKGSNQIYGVLPYIAPEVLRGENYTTASDIYSFGIVMNTLVSGKRPWYYRAHDASLAKDICNGKRLEIPEDTPKFYVELMQQCWDNEPAKRPTASFLNEKLREWDTTIICKLASEILDEFSIAEEKRWEMIFKMISEKYTHPEIHVEAYYKSRLLYFPELSSNYSNYNGKISLF
jgi:serine/threonine protein kinase